MPSSVPSSPKRLYQELTVLSSDGEETSQGGETSASLRRPRERELFGEQQPRRGMGYPTDANFQDFSSLQGEADSLRDAAQVRKNQRTNEQTNQNFFIQSFPFLSFHFEMV
mmetsp:Transcript_9703/g.27649  ORF Transcript_9703/g.27649 Transcript_9703/m.27649 type:complete len:111 (-) Transcript_9703:2404-2736(-)